VCVCVCLCVCILVYMYYNDVSPIVTRPLSIRLSPAVRCTSVTSPTVAAGAPAKVCLFKKACVSPVLK
jgi:hypothetical protein